MNEEASRRYRELVRTRFTGHSGNQEQTQAMQGALERHRAREHNEALTGLKGAVEQGKSQEILGFVEHARRRK